MRPGAPAAAELRQIRRERNPGKVVRNAVVDARTEVYQRNMRYASMERALELFREARSRNVILSPDLCREFVLVRPFLIQRVLLAWHAGGGKKALHS